MGDLKCTRLVLATLLASPLAACAGNSMQNTSSSPVLPFLRTTQNAPAHHHPRFLHEFKLEKGAYPSPAPWSAATYAANYAPLTPAYLNAQTLSPAHFVVEYDATGHVWVAPPGGYDAYNRGQDFGANTDVCQAAIG